VSYVSEVSTKRAIYVKRYTEAPSPSNHCRRKAIRLRVTIVSVALVFQHAKRMRRTKFSPESWACIF